MSLPQGPGSGMPDLSAPISAVSPRARFITRTYTHLLGAVLGFTLLEVALFQSGLAASIARALLGTSWLLVLGAFMVVSWLATRAAHKAGSLAVQYAALSASWRPRRSSSCRSSTSSRPWPRARSGAPCWRLSSASPV
jgi:hypothetical protein